MSRSTAVRACAVAAAVPAVLAAALTPAWGKTGRSLYVQGTEIASVRGGSLALRAAPGSPRVLARVGRTTEFGSTTRMPVVAEDGDWVELISDRLDNGAHAFVRRSELDLTRRPFVLEADLTRRRLVVWRWDQPIRRFAIAIGAPGSPTPSGRFSITDKLRDYHSATYGCCILALSGHQTHLPRWWRGGDRLAIHEGGGLGAGVSAGCVHANRAAMRYLLRTIPLGTQIFIHR
jgi:lipoprotein-anchoring transpeptidase ErfK/SrfK